MACCVPSRCILWMILVSTAVTVLVCMASGLVLILAPEEPWAYLYNGGNYTRVPAFVLLLAALLSLLTGFLGCCGLFRDSQWTLVMFSVCVLLIAVMEAAAAGTVFAFTYTGEIKGDLADQLHKDIRHFNTSSTESRLNKLQSSYHCCGVKSYMDWSLGSPELAPQSCCKAQYSDLSNCTQDPNTLHSQGCVVVLMDRLEPVMDSILAVNIMAVILQVSTASVACCGARLITRYKHYRIL